MKTDNGGPAKDETLLDKRAGEAMQAILSSKEGKGAAASIGEEEGVCSSEVLAKGAYQMADFMIAEKRRREGE